jgi:hypothetical protein
MAFYRNQEFENVLFMNMSNLQKALQYGTEQAQKAGRPLIFEKGKDEKNLTLCDFHHIISNHLQKHGNRKINSLSPTATTIETAKRKLL